MKFINAIGTTWNTFTALVDAGFKLVLGFLLLGFGMGLLVTAAMFLYHAFAR